MHVSEGFASAAVDPANVHVSIPPLRWLSTAEPLSF